MINRSFKKIIQTALNNNLAFFSSSHHQEIPTKLPKVSQIVVNLYVKNKYGVVEKVPAFVGESLLEAITRMKVHSFREDNCNGYDFTYRPHYRPHDNDTTGPNCGNCKVVLLDNWFERINQETDGFNSNQQVILNTATADLKSNTRLACCIPIQSWMEGLTCEVDPQPMELPDGILV